MNKTKKLTIECGLTFLMFLGVWWWVGREYKKTHPEPKTVTVEHVKVYQGHWVEDIQKVGEWWSVGYLEVIK